MIKLVKIRGDSMLPTLFDGDTVITTKPRVVHAGLIYVVDHSDLGLIIKRLDSFDNRGRARLTGDNPRSTPSAVMGTVETERFVGQARFAFGKSGLRKLERKP